MGERAPSGTSIYEQQIRAGSRSVAASAVRNADLKISITLRNSGSRQQDNSTNPVHEKLMSAMMSITAFVLLTMMSLLALVAAIGAEEVWVLDKMETSGPPQMPNVIKTGHFFASPTDGDAGADVIGAAVLKDGPSTALAADVIGADILEDDPELDEAVKNRDGEIFPKGEKCPTEDADDPEEDSISRLAGISVIVVFGLVCYLLTTLGATQHHESTSATTTSKIRSSIMIEHDESTTSCSISASIRSRPLHRSLTTPISRNELLLVQGMMNLYPTPSSDWEGGMKVGKWRFESQSKPDRVALASDTQAGVSMEALSSASPASSEHVMEENDTTTNTHMLTAPTDLFPNQMDSSTFNQAAQETLSAIIAPFAPPVDGPAVLMAVWPAANPQAQSINQNGTGATGAHPPAINATAAGAAPQPSSSPPTDNLATHVYTGDTSSATPDHPEEEATQVYAVGTCSTSAAVAGTGGEMLGKRSGPEKMEEEEPKPLKKYKSDTCAYTEREC